MGRDHEAAGHAAVADSTSTSWSSLIDEPADADTLSRARRAAWIEADYLTARSRPAAASASRIRRRAMASARRRCARRLLGSPRAASSMRSASAVFASSRCRARTSPTSCASAPCLSARRLRLSMAAGDGAWEGEIVAALHQLKRYILNEPARVRRGRARFRRACTRLPHLADCGLRLAASLAAMLGSLRRGLPLSAADDGDLRRAARSSCAATRVLAEAGDRAVAASARGFARSPYRLDAGAGLPATERECVA